MTEYSPEISRLCIKNLDLIHEAPKIIEEVDQVILDVCMEIWEEFYNDMGWNGKASKYHDKKELRYCGPNNWRQDEKGNMIDCYAFEFFHEDIVYWIDHFLAYNPANSAAIVVYIDYKTLDLSLKEFKSILTGKYEAISKLQELGVSLKDEYLYIPYKFDRDRLLEEYPDNLDESLQPLRDALETVKKAHKEIDRVRREIIKDCTEKETSKKAAAKKAKVKKSGKK